MRWCTGRTASRSRTPCASAPASRSRCAWSMEKATPGSSSIRWSASPMEAGASTAASSAGCRARKPSRALARRRPLLAVAFAPQARHGRAKRDRRAAIAADAVAGQAGIQRLAVKADAVAAVAEDIVTVERDLHRPVFMLLHRPVPVAVAAVVADAIAAQRVRAGRAVEGDAVLPVAVHHAAAHQAAAAGEAGGAAPGDVEARFAVLDHEALRHHQPVGAPVRDAEAVRRTVAAEDLDAARRRPFALLQLDEDAVRGVVAGNAVGDVGALDAAPAADADADPGAAGLLTVVQAPAVHGVHALEHAVLQEVAAQARRGGVVDIKIAERGTHHELEVESLGARLVLVELHPGAVDLEVEEAAVVERPVAARPMLLAREAGERDRLAVALEHEARRPFARADEGHAASPH